MFALMVLFFCAIAAPISWKKAQFQDSLIWCGWEINFSHDTIQLVSAKLTSWTLDQSTAGKQTGAPKNTRTVHRPAHLGHQHCTAFEILASAAIL